MKNILLDIISNDTSYNKPDTYIIGHWTNLRMIEKTENYSKGMRCDKTQDQLFNDFFSTIG